MMSGGYEDTRIFIYFIKQTKDITFTGNKQIIPAIANKSEEILLLKVLLVTVSSLVGDCVLLTCWRMPEFSFKVVHSSHTLITTRSNFLPKP